MTIANMAWTMYPDLSHSAMNALERHGTPEQKQRFLTLLLSGACTGTMCLTEPHAGSDVGILRTKAVPNADGTYAITGTKIFISAGEHDFVDNILHLVLARVPNAPPRHEGHLAVHRAEVHSARRRNARSAQRRAVHRHRRKDGHSRQRDVRAELRRRDGLSWSAPKTKACAACSR